MVDRELDVPARPFRPGGDDLDRAAERVANDRLAAGAPRQGLVERPLEPFEAPVVDAGVAEDVCADPALWVGPQLLDVEPEPRDLLPLELRRLERVGLAEHVDEPCRAVGEQRVELVGVEIECLAGGDSCRLGIPHEPRIRVHGRRLLADCEGEPVRSKIVPRAAGSSIVSRCWRVAIASYDGPLTA